jgi:hypothetical protein
LCLISIITIGIVEPTVEQNYVSHTTWEMGAGMWITSCGVNEIIAKGVIPGNLEK